MKGSNFAKPEDSPGFMLWQTYLRWKRQVEDALTHYGITHVQFVLLTSLAYLKSANQVTLASFSQCHVSMVSQVIRTLVKKGCVTRKQKSTDERAYYLRLTKEGQAMVEKTVKAVEAVDQEFFCPVEKEVLHCLTMLIQNI